MVHKIGVISVALGITVMLVSLLTFRGFEENLQQKIFSFHGHLQITHYTKQQLYESLPISSHKVKNLKAAFPNDICYLQPFAYKTALLKTTEGIEGIVLKGLAPYAFEETLKPYIIQGNFLDTAKKGYSRNIMISSKTAAKLNLALGHEVIVYFVQDPPRYRKLRITGIYNTAMEALDEKLVLCDLGLIQKLNHWPDSLVGGYEVFVNHVDKIEQIEDVLWGWLDYDVSVQNTAVQQAALFDWLTLLHRNVIIFMIFILLVVSANIMAVVLIQIWDRISMIGILKTLGASNRQIGNIFFWNNIQVIAKGMFWGNLIGLGIGMVQDIFKIIRLDPTVYYMAYVPVYWSWPAIVLLNVFTIIIVMLVAWLSLALIIRWRPIQAIRFN